MNEQTRSPAVAEIGDHTFRLLKHLCCTTYRSGIDMVSMLSMAIPDIAFFGEGVEVSGLRVNIGG